MVAAVGVGGLTKEVAGEGRAGRSSRDWSWVCVALLLYIICMLALMLGVC